MPRPKELVKGLLIPTTYALGVLAGGHVGGASLIRALVVLAAAELLVYPARYQRNDVRGFVADQHHPGGDRGRLPGPLSGSSAWPTGRRWTRWAPTSSVTSRRTS
ncbi:MAG: hypothetical protein M3O32_04215 [Actinomycetota bacterium]|nr:hypothetical protein [Actinomycetota bacterium]